MTGVAIKEAPRIASPMEPLKEGSIHETLVLAGLMHSQLCAKEILINSRIKQIHFWTPQTRLIFSAMTLPFMVMGRSITLSNVFSFLQEKKLQDHVNAEYLYKIQGLSRNDDSMRPTNLTKSIGELIIHYNRRARGARASLGLSEVCDDEENED